MNAQLTLTSIFGLLCLSLLPACTYSGVQFVVLSGGRKQPTVSEVFADANKLAKEQGFIEENILQRDEVKSVRYRGKYCYLWVEHYSYWRYTGIKLIADSTLQKGATTKFRDEFLHRFSDKYGRANISTSGE